MNAAERKLRAAEKAVEEAEDRLAGARLEVANLRGQAADVDAALTASIAEAVRGGAPVSVDDARAHARDLADERATAETIASTLEQVVADRLRDVEAVRLECFPELRSGLDTRAQKLADQIAAVHEKYARELEPLEAASEDLKAEWSSLRGALPRALTSTLRLEMLGLTVPPLEPHVGLAQYDPRDPSLPNWLRPLIEQSRRLVEQQNPVVPIGVPVAPGGAPYE
jgi:chromosome segregation ATPase